MARRSVPGVSRIKRGARDPQRAHRAGTRKSRTRTGTGAGYSTNRGDSRTHFEISIVHGDWGNTVLGAKRIVDQNLGSLQKYFKSLEKEKIQVPKGNQGASLSFVEKDTPKTRSTGAGIDKLTIDPFLALQNLPVNAARELLNDIGTIGISEVRHGIRNPEGRPRSSRYDTGLMYNSVDQRIRYNKESVTVQVGWNRTFRKYFDYQERGTFLVGSMNAIQGGYRRTVPKAYNLMSRYFANYSKKTGFSGRYDK
jgi:hypothetical protein